jgi:hypothetical protein
MEGGTTDSPARRRLRGTLRRAWGAWGAAPKKIFQKPVPRAGSIRARCYLRSVLTDRSYAIRVVSRESRRQRVERRCQLPHRQPQQEHAVESQPQSRLPPCFGPLAAQMNGWMASTEQAYGPAPVFFSGRKGVCPFVGLTVRGGRAGSKAWICAVESPPAPLLSRGHAMAKPESCRIAFAHR